MADAGNPVGFGDGCATVTGYKLSKPLAEAGKAGARFEARSQDIGRSCSSWFRMWKHVETNFSVKEKDEASLLNQF